MALTGISVAHQRRAATCDSALPDLDAYNLPLHIGALFIILAVSTAAAAFPLLAARFPFLRVPTDFFFAARHFGTGVLLATAFCHLLPTAFSSLGDPCLSEFWVNDYPAMPGAISLAGIFLVAIIEMVFHPARKGSNMLQPELQVRPPVTALESLPHVHTGIPPAGNDAIIAEAHNGEVQAAQLLGSETGAGQPVKAAVNEAMGSPGDNGLSGLSEQHRQILQCVLLEVGILFHSVFIGMALSVSVGTDFVVLLIAIAFHQSFEGLALGSRIASINWDSYPSRPWLMAIVYGCTTPIGQALGLATHTMYSPTSPTGLVLVGTMNAISSGLLIFASLIELLAEDFLSESSWQVLRGKRRIYACICVFAGAFSMSLVGAWA